MFKQPAQISSSHSAKLELLVELDSIGIHSTVSLFNSEGGNVLECWVHTITAHSWLLAPTVASRLPLVREQHHLEKLDSSKAMNRNAKNEEWRFWK